MKNAKVTRRGMPPSSAKIIVGLDNNPKEGSMALNGNKALDLDGLSHLVDTYIKNVKVQDGGTNLGDTLYLTHTNTSDVTSDLSLSVEPVSGVTTLMVTSDALSNPAIWHFTGITTQGENWVASKAYVDAKTWDASDITSGTLAAERIPTLNISLKTSGTLPITRGGTGRTTAPSMLVNLASTTAASPLSASPRPGVTGTLPITRGGTGATTTSAAKANLGIGDYGKLTASSSSATPNVVKICDASWTTLVVDVYALSGSANTTTSLRFGSYYVSLQESHMYVFHQVGGYRIYCFDYGTRKSSAAANVTPSMRSWPIVTTGQVTPNLYAEGTADSTCEVTINYQVA